ncbi:MAG: 4-hydroxy-3-methylbut-2-enyl diphosphate reductase [Elusimicrobiota bacterium]|jgi:4-hydroxy-3-methylbut-2-enyl diphosphate reductase|nr:4-hydroxy-3-methylbut-2-enyl diphosphate reductase [Elusimicrobiota bacterium]
MAKITVAKKAGFCFGVKRAIKMAQEAVLKNKKTFVIGSLIHNPQEIKRLQKLGIKTLKSPNVKSGIIILRTHGISSDLYDRLKKRKSIELADAVCPFVKRAQKIVENLGQKGERIVIVGEKDHPEIIALRSYAGKKCIIINDVGQAQKIKTQEPLNIVSQTTQSLENFDAIVKVLRRNHKIKIFNTICKATFDRQKEAAELAKTADLMIVIGGMNSANTSRLAQICKDKTITRHIETVGSLKKSWFKGKKNICITAGASTPDWIIKDIRFAIENIIN